MRKMQMLNRFCEIAKEFISTLDEEGLEYDFLCNQVDIDKQGPCCSDSKLIHLFRDNIKSEISENELYQLIGNICEKFVYG